ncbi:hypothetical protein D9M71_719550 [compost metagenome]
MQLALNIALRPLLQILASDLGNLSAKHDTMPFGAFFLLAGLLILPAFTGGDGHVSERMTARSDPAFRISAAIANDDYFVYAACHVLTLKLLQLLFTKFARLLAPCDDLGKRHFSFTHGRLHRRKLLREV